MALTKLLADVVVHQTLSDEPNANDGITAAQLKEKYDQAAVDIKAYVNNTLTTELDIALANKVDAGNAVDLTTNQTIGGTKTFINLIKVPLLPVANEDATSKKYVDDEITGVVLGDIPDGSLTDDKLSNDPGQIKDRVNDLETEVNSPSYSTPSTQMAQVQALPINALSGKMLTRIKGESLVQEVSNGDFEGGTSDWSLSQAIGNVASNVYSVTGDGTGTFPKIEQSYEFIASNKYYLCTKIKQTNSNVFKDIRIGTSAEYVITSAIENQDVEICGMLTASASSLLRVGATFNNTSDANGATFDINGEFGVYVINMTALGIESYTDEQMLELVRSMQAGTTEIQSVIPKLRTVGKNLFDETNIVDGMFIDTTDGVTILTSATRSYGDQFIGVKENTTYFYQISDPSVSANYIYYYDRNKNFISRSGDVENLPFTTPSGCAFIRWSIITGAGNLIANKTRLWITEGGITTSYEPYQESELEYATKLARLPNGVQDELFNAVLDGGELKSTDMWVLEENIQEKALETSDITSLVTSGTNIDYVRISKPLNYIGYNNTNNILGNAILTGYVDGIYADDVSKIGQFVGISATGWGLIVAKGTYATLVDAQNDLAGTKVQYQLATSQVEKVLLNDLQSFEDGTLYDESSPIAEIELSVPQNLKAVVDTNTEMINKNLGLHPLVVKTGKQIQHLDQETFIDFTGLENGTYELILSNFNGQVYLTPADLKFSGEVKMDGTTDTFDYFLLVPSSDFNNQFKSRKFDVQITDENYVITQQSYNIGGIASGTSIFMAVSWNNNGKGKILKFFLDNPTCFVDYTLIKKSLI